MRHSVAPVCEHGQTGFCYNEATPEQRKQLARLHTHAYDWALSVDIDRDIAERYASDYARENFTLDIADAPNHKKFYESWRD